jgi:hypothetical protein
MAANKEFLSWCKAHRFEPTVTHEMVWEAATEAAEALTKAPNTQSKQCQCGCALQDHICPTGLLRFTEVCA